MKKIDVNKTLEEIDGEVWDDPGKTTKLIRTCHELRKVPLKDLTADNLRLMIGQKLNLEHLVPLALGILAKDPFVETQFYRGDLLAYVLKNTNEEFWNQHHDLYLELDEVMSVVKQTFEELSPLLNHLNPYQIE
ncbi:contact-dependent growth inhibition system immunity protein [Brevibacillus nitrificans]|uniref:contact-dependent growth inhibition system immunity protein n=1 Tax=Brevibacillus nitrificans TaxID=651560 RepID=UPI002616167D|nr:contact-dependent growth inhibition system immunity protein [Brevibacillus nitrificans]MED1795179.1 contact-dependent growth inhibition system immunity protein [Brevibacillus nitrificans]